MMRHWQWAQVGAQAGEPLVLTQDKPQVDAWEAVTLKADPTYQLSVQDMLSQLRAFEAPAHRGGSIGVHKAAMWLHIPIVAPEAPRTPWVVNIGYSSLQAELYLASGGKVPDLIKPFGLERFSTFQQVNEMGATAASH